MFICSCNPEIALCLLLISSVTEPKILSSAAFALAVSVVINPSILSSSASNSVFKFCICPATELLPVPSKAAILLLKALSAFCLSNASAATSESISLCNSVFKAESLAIASLIASCFAVAILEETVLTYALYSFWCVEIESANSFNVFIASGAPFTKAVIC